MLPEPAPGFRWVPFAGRPALVNDALAGAAPHLFTSRSWSLGSDGASPREDSWAAVAVASGVGPDRLIRLRQVHGAHVVVHRAGEAIPRLPEADAVVTDDPAVALAVQAADCVPLLIADTRTGAVAAVHAGWRGLVAGTPAAAIQTMSRVFGSRPADLVVAAGPSIGACCYEVGEDVRSAFATAHAPHVGWFMREPLALQDNPPMPGVAGGRPGKWFFDGWQATRDLLERAGVTRIHQARVCTASHGDLPSYRRDGKGAGRLAGTIRMR